MSEWEKAGIVGVDSHHPAPGAPRSRSGYLARAYRSLVTAFQRHTKSAI